MYNIIIHSVSIKTCRFHFRNNSVQYWPILIIFGTQHHEETWRKRGTLAHLTLLLLLHYLVKCRSRSLAVYNDEFMLGSTRVSSKNHRDHKIIEKPVTYFTLVVFILKSYVDKLKWRINSEWTGLGRELLKVLLASRVNVHRLRSCWRRHFKHAQQ